MNILVPLGTFLGAAVAPLARRVLTALGMGYISYSILTTIIDQAIMYAKDQYMGLPSAVLGLAGLAGIGECMGIITAAITFRIGFMAQRKVIGVLNK